MFTLLTTENKKVDLRNLEEQVQFLTELHETGKVFANWGIKIVGTVPTVGELPSNYDGDYGDAYAVGTAAPYDFYIWTRPVIEGGLPYWFPFGQLAIQGPQGPQGPKGDKGDTGSSTQWYTTTYTQTYPTGVELHIGDMLLWPDGTVLTFRKLGLALTPTWIPLFNIKGAQGPQGIPGEKGATGATGAQGPKGDTGDVGGFINIRGIVTNTDQLPSPATLGNLTFAYLLGTQVPYDLYIQVGRTSAEAEWVNSGPLNVSTLVSVGGQYVNLWDADTKLDRDTHVTDYNQVYVKSADGGVGHINVTKSVIADAVVQRESDGEITVPENTTQDNAAISKKQADSTYLSKTGFNLRNGTAIVSLVQAADNGYGIDGPLENEATGPDGSAAFGVGNKAKGYSAFVVGQVNTADNGASGALIAGNNNTVSGAYSHILGQNNRNAGWASTIAGIANTLNWDLDKEKPYATPGQYQSVGNLVSGKYNRVRTSDHSNVSGSSNEVLLGSDSVITGIANNVRNSDRNCVSGSGNNMYNVQNSAVTGFENIINNTTNSVISGNMNNIDYTENSLAMGGKNTIGRLLYGIVCGYENNIPNAGVSSIVVGSNNTLDSKEDSDNCIFGSSNRSYGQRNFVIGTNNNMSSASYNSVVSGNSNLVEGHNSIGIGSQNILKGYASSAIGDGNQSIWAGAENVHLIGKGLFTQSGNQILLGKYNEQTPDLLAVGYGTAQNNRKNAFNITQNGNVRVALAPTQPTDVVRLQELNNLKELLKNAGINIT